MAITSTKVVRNDIEAEFKSTEVKRGKEAGWKFLELDVNGNNLISTIIPWIGVDAAVQIVKAALRQRAMGWSAEAEEESKDKTTGAVDETKYIDVFSEMAKSFSARGEKISELMAQIMELVGEMGELDLSNPDGMTRAQAIATEVKALQIAIASKKRKTAEDKAAEEAAEANK